MFILYNVYFGIIGFGLINSLLWSNLMVLLILWYLLKLFFSVVLYICVIVLGIMLVVMEIMLWLFLYINL